jgi:hypothetical protein
MKFIVIINFFSMLWSVSPASLGPLGEGKNIDGENGSGDADELYRNDSVSSVASLDGSPQGFMGVLAKVAEFMFFGDYHPEDDSSVHERGGSPVEKENGFSEVSGDTESRKAGVTAATSELNTDVLDDAQIGVNAPSFHHATADTGGLVHSEKEAEVASSDYHVQESHASTIVSGAPEPQHMSDRVGDGGESGRCSASDCAECGKLCCECVKGCCEGCCQFCCACGGGGCE